MILNIVYWKTPPYIRNDRKGSKMNSHIHTPCVMRDTDQFFVRVCGCGIIHLCFGATTLNLAPEALIAVTETLKDLSDAIKMKMKADPINADAATIGPGGVVVRGNFPRHP